MLKNLLKYDLKWVYKGLGIFYLLSFTFAILTRALSLVDSTIIIIIGKICAGITISMLINILINNSMRNWARFITNFYKDEAYLTHTLPVTKKKLYLSKVLTATITTLSSILVITICLFITYYSKDNVELLKNTLDLAASTYNSSVVNLVFIMLITFFIQFLYIILIGFSGAVLGYNKNNLKIAIEKTFKKRNFNQNPIKNIEIIKSSEILKIKWKSYTLKNKYAKNIDFNETIKCLEQFIKIIDVVTT